MAAVLDTLTSNRVGNLHSAQEGDRNSWEFNTPVIQEVSLPVHLSMYSSIRFPVFIFIFL